MKEISNPHNLLRSLSVLLKIAPWPEEGLSEYLYRVAGMSSMLPFNWSFVEVSFAAFPLLSTLGMNPYVSDAIMEELSHFNGTVLMVDPNIKLPDAMLLVITCPADNVSPYMRWLQFMRHPRLLINHNKQGDIAVLGFPLIAFFK